MSVGQAFALGMVTGIVVLAVLIIINFWAGLRHMLKVSRQHQDEEED